MRRIAHYRSTMHTPALALLCLLALSSFHGELLARAQEFNLQSGKLSGDDFTLSNNAMVDTTTGTLVLNATAGAAHALYKSSVSLSSSTTRSVQSFSTFFTFSSDVNGGNGTVAFVAVVDPEKTALADARKTLTVEFNASCSGGFYNASSGEWDGGPGWGYGGHPWGGRGWDGGPGWGYGGHPWGGRGWGGGFHGGLGGFQVVEYTDSTSIGVNATAGYGPDWDDQPADGPYFCSQQPDVDLFQYQVALEYNATTQTVWVGSPSCGTGFARTTQFEPRNLSDVITGSVYVGFIVTGGVFNLSQWNFTSNTNASSVLSLALSASTGDGSSSNGGGGHHGRGGGLAKGWIIAFSLLGAAIAIGAVVCVCCLCVAKRRRRVATSTKFVAKSVGTIPESAVVFDATKPPKMETAPLNTFPNSATSTHTASWLQPVAPR